MCISNLLYSQTYQTTVVNSEQKPLAFATVLIINEQTNLLTDENGFVQFKLDLQNFEIRVSSIGYKPTILQIEDGELPSQITLNRTDEQLENVVVTALGVKRETQSIVSSIAVVDSEQLAEVPQTNTVNALAGKAAGVQITNGSSGVGSSSRIIIRGLNSLSGDNQPLFVVDGVPISNAQITSNLVNNGALQEVDWGNGGAEISPSDIESISLLKGAGSAALYGSRAANGVVLITTKKGEKTGKLGIDVHSSFTVDGLLTLPEYQNKYGGGSNGEYAFVDGAGAGTNDGGISSYGPRLDAGLFIPQFDSPSVDVAGNPVRGGDVLVRQNPDGSYTEIEPTPWVARPDNVRDFFETGITSQNNFALNSSTDKNNTRFSYSNLRNKGVLPNTNLDRDIVSLSLQQNLSNHVEFKTFINYINNRSDNRPNLGYGYENVMYGFNWTGRQADLSAMKNYWQAGNENTQHYDINYLWVTNPYLTLNENTNSFLKNRVLGNASVSIDLTENFTIQARTGTDIYNDNREFRRAVSTNANPTGSYREDQVQFREINSDVLATFSNDLSDELNLVLSAGGNRFDQSIEYSFAQASQLALPGIYSLANSGAPLSGNSQLFEKRINSLYGYGTLSLNNYLYLDATYRQDWSSTLPKENNSFGYYSAGLSYGATNQLNLPTVVNFLKIRGSAASVGNDTQPYQTTQTYLLNDNYNSNFRVTNESVLKNPNLKPERLIAFELGIEGQLLDSNITFDLSAYQNTSRDQIISRPTSIASGFSNFNVNGGKIRTRGFEAFVNATAINTDDFSWNTSFNFSTAKSIVTELPENVNQFVTATADVFSGDGGSNTIFFIARKDEQVGNMYGTGFTEVEGQTLYNSNGLPVQDGTLKLLGNYTPDFSLGWNNKFTYDNFLFSFLVDWRQGGEVVSRTKALGSTSGVLKETLTGRENGIIGNGVMNIGTDDNPNYVPNTTLVSANQYYNSFFDRGNEVSAVYDASFLKLRQMNLAYKLPDTNLFTNAQIGLVGTNLLLFTENPHFDPELNAFQGKNIVYGVEDMSYPSTRSIGIHIKSNF